MRHEGSKKPLKRGERKGEDGVAHEDNVRLVRVATQFQACPLCEAEIKIAGATRPPIRSAKKLSGQYMGDELN